MRRIIWTTVLATLMCGPVLADFSGSGELGLVAARGNTETDTLNARLRLDYSRDRWNNESNFNMVHSRDSGETRANRFVLANKTEYDLNERSYVLGALRYDRDRFSDYRYQGTASLGYGYHLIDSERHRLKAEIGPGARWSEDRVTEETHTDFIIRGFLGYGWTISENAGLTNRLLVESASENTFTENETAVTVAINSRLSLKAGFTVRHNSDVEPETKNTDTLTTVNIVYNFK